MPDVMSVLERARTMELEVETQLEHIQMLRRIANRARSSVEYAQSTAEKLARLERQVNSAIDEMCDAKALALRYISFLTGEERSVIEGYYILGKTWDQLSLSLYMSERRVYMLRKSAIAKLLKRYDCPPGNEKGTAART